jgi:hypothetical protein
MVPMNRLGNKIASSVLALAAAASLVACGAGSHSSTLPAPQPTASGVPGYTGPLANAIFQITIPAPPKSTGTTRRPAYVSSSTSKVVFTLNTASALTTGQVTSINTLFLGAKAVTLGSATCPGSGPWTCTFTMTLPPGSDNLTVSAQDASSNILSQQVQTLSVVAGGSAGAANNFSLTLDANASTMTIQAIAGYCASSFPVSANQTVGTVGTSGVNFTVSFTDPAGKTIVGPGLPLLKINGSSTAGTIGSGAAAVDFNINQSAQTFTLTAHSSSSTQTIPFTATPPASDGLGYSKPLSFTFQSAPAPPSSFLAAIEQTNSTPGTMAGQVDLFMLTLGASDTFTNFSPATLAPEGGDIDNPQDMLFDGNGDLLIANGGAGNSDFGNFACIPAGSIATGANNATVLTNGTPTAGGADDPAYIALGTDSNVSIGNVPAAAANHVMDFILSGQYVAASSTRDISSSSYSGMGTQGLVALPTSGLNPAGTYAASITDGVNQSNSYIVVKHPNGTVANIQSTNLVDGVIAYDGDLSTNEIVAGSNNGANSHLVTYSASTLSSTPTHDFIIQNDGTGASNMAPYAIAANPTTSSSGYIAVAGATNSGEPEVQIYDANRNPKSVILYDLMDPTCSTFAYGNSTIIVHSMRFLTATKLLVALETDNGGTKGTTMGLYTYDVSQTSTPSGSYYFGSSFACTPAGAGPLQTGYHTTSHIPLSAAYRP